MLQELELVVANLVGKVAAAVAVAAVVVAAMVVVVVAGMGVANVQLLVLLGIEPKSFRLRARPDKHVEYVLV